MYIKKLEHEPLNLDLYKRDLPSKLRPAHVRMILNDGLIDEVSLVATLVDLIDKGYINFVRKEKEMIFSKTNKSYENLLDFEKFLIFWLFDKYGDGNEVTSTQISYSLTNNIYEEKPYQLFNYFQSSIFISFPFRKYYNELENVMSNRLKYYAIMLIGFFPLTCFMFVYGFARLFFASPGYFLTDKAIEEKDKWLD